MAGTALGSTGFTIVFQNPAAVPVHAWVHVREAAFADMTVEVCDGLPSYVEDGTVTSDRFCPWSAEIVSID